MTGGQVGHRFLKIEICPQLSPHELWNSVELDGRPWASFSYNFTFIRGFLEFGGILLQAIGVAEKHLNPRPQPTLTRIIVLRAPPCHVQLERAHRHWRFLSPQAARRSQ